MLTKWQARRLLNRHGIPYRYVGDWLECWDECFREGTACGKWVTVPRSRGALLAFLGY
jgi:hypothetical protein